MCALHELNEAYHSNCTEEIEEVEIIVRDLSNEDMLRMMARENMEEWGTSAWVELETIRATIEAYGEGKIELPAVPSKTPKTQVRHVHLGSDAHPYTKTNIAEFLGWTKKNRDGDTPNFACETAFRAIDMIDAGFLSESDLRGLTRSQMSELVQHQWDIYQRETRIAEQNRKEAEVAKQRAAITTAPVERQRYEKQAAIHEEQAEQHKVMAREKAKDFGKEAVDMFRRGEGVRTVRDTAETYKPEVPRATKVINVDDFANRLAAKLEGIANGQDSISDDIVFLRDNKLDLSDRAVDGLCQSFKALIDRLGKAKRMIES